MKKKKEQGAVVGPMIKTEDGKTIYLVEEESPLEWIADVFVKSMSIVGTGFTVFLIHHFLTK